MNKSAKVLLAAFTVTAMVTVFVLSCNSKNETRANTADTLQVDSSQVVKADTIVSAEVDSATAK